MAREQMMFFRSYYEAANELPPKDQLAFYKAIFALGFDGEEPEVPKSAKAAFLGIRPNIIRSGKRADARRAGINKAKNAEAGGDDKSGFAKTNGGDKTDFVEAGGDGKTDFDDAGGDIKTDFVETSGSNKIEFDAATFAQMTSLGIGKGNGKGKEKGNGNGNGNGTGNGNGGGMGEPGVPAGGVGDDGGGDGDDGGESERANVSEVTPAETPGRGIPTQAEVCAYCRERGNRVDPDRFWRYYTIAGWKIGGTPIHDWKAVFRSWEGREPGPGGSPGSPGSPGTPGSSYNPDEFWEIATRDSLSRHGKGGP